jgi:hypothetical protein
MDGGRQGTGEVQPEEEQERVLDEEVGVAQYSQKRYWDAITNEELPAELTAASRAKEIESMRKWKFSADLRVLECWKVTGRAPLQSKWVDVNTGDFERPVEEAGAWRRMSRTTSLMSSSPQPLL